MHLLPCRIEYRGDAPVDGYFTPLVCDSDGRQNGELSCNFRGRPLTGAKRKLPEGVQGECGFRLRSVYMPPWSN